MDLAKIEEHIQILRQRRLSLPELRDYKPQTRAKAKVTPVVADATPVEELFSGLFTTEEPNDDTSK